MLSKVIKYEFKSTSKIFLLLNVATLLVSILAGIINRTNLQFLSENNNLLTMFMILIEFSFVFVLAASPLATFFIPASRFRKSMFSEEGYLTNVLPVKSSTLIFGKATAYAIWSIINGIVVVISASLFIFIQAFEDMEWDIFDFGDFFSYTGAAGALFLLELIVGALVTIFLTISTVYLAIAIGNLFSNHKTFASVAAFFLLYIALETVIGFAIAGALQLFDSTDLLVAASEANDVKTLLFAVLPFPAVAILGLALITALFFAITNYIVSRRLNLA